MNRHLLPVVIAFVVAAGASLAHSQQPYAGLEGRSIKALSEQQIADLQAGRGMGLALAAELNGYPGPMHVLEFADSLGLSDQQRAKMQELSTASDGYFGPLHIENIQYGPIRCRPARASAPRLSHQPFHFAQPPLLSPNSSHY